MRKLAILIVNGYDGGEEEANEFMESLIKRGYIKNYVQGGTWANYFGVAKAVDIRSPNICMLWKYGKGDDVCPHARLHTGLVFCDTASVCHIIIDALQISESAKERMREACDEYKMGKIDINTLTGNLSTHFRSMLDDTLRPGHIPVVYNLYTDSTFFTLRCNEYAVVMDYEPEDSNTDR